MQSLNFEFLRPKYNALADLAAFAELYAASDPPSAAVKLRAFAELLTGAIYERFRFPRPFESEFVRLLTAEPFKTAVPLVVVHSVGLEPLSGNPTSNGCLQ